MPRPRGGVSQVQIAFNPAFQTVLLHEAAVWREGRKLDRLKDVRHELVRREQRLEQQVIDGVQTLLTVLSDVRVDKPVDLAYTIVGQNPIYEGKLTAGYTVASDVPVDVLHLRIESPADRPLNHRTMVDVFSAEQFTERGRQVLRVVRQRVPAVLQEQGTPPWFKVFPALMVSEYRDWAEVDAWAQRLIAAPAQPAASNAAQAQQLGATGLTGEALVDETLRFVQDEVRHFSVSLGESSHRPKPAERSLGQRLGDCKDKGVPLNALLQALGFDARPALDAWAKRSNGMPARQWAGNVQVLRQQGAAAEPALREVVANGGGEEREFALLWLYLAAEQQGRGREAIAPHVAQADGKKLTGALLQFFDGRIDRDAVLKLASEKPDMERLNFAEAWFFIGQPHLLRGQKDEALRAMRRVLDTGALPLREYSFAKFLADQLARQLARR